MTYTKKDYFSPEDVVIGFCNIKEAYNYYNYKNDVNKNLVIKAYKDPYIYHYIMLVDFLNLGEVFNIKIIYYVLILSLDFMKQREKLRIFMKF